MFLHVKGEGLNVGCNLTWGPCYDFQRQFFEPTVNKVSEPLTVLKYDIEVSGFGSQALGHVCLLNLRDQTYPGSEGTKTKGWPTWTTPLMRWAKAQGAVTGYAHSANGLVRQPDRLRAKRLLAELRRQQGRRCSARTRPRRPAARGLRGHRHRRRRLAVSVTELADSVNRHARASCPTWRPGDERHRRPGNLRDRCRRGCATSSAPWTRSASRSGTAGITS